MSELEQRLAEERPILFDREALIANLDGHEGFRALLEALDDAQDEKTRHIAALLMTSKKEVDQRTVDYTRGYYGGARYWLNGRINLAKERVRLAAAQRAEESD